jgi:glycosyltransferase involved in cell wall biosynthesis
VRLLVFGDSAQTGFGTVTWNVGLRLLAMGVDLRLISQNVSMDPIPHPLGERTWDIAKVASAIPMIFARGFTDGWKPEACIILGDYAAVRATVLNHPTLTKAFASVPTFHYCPVEGVGLPPRWKGLWDIVHPVAMSEFGAGEIAKVTGQRPPMIYHGVSTEDFYPVAMNRPGNWLGTPVRTRDQAKAMLSYPTDRTMVLRTDRHMPRKRYNSLLRAMVPVFEACPEVDLVIHCSSQDQGGDLKDSISKLPERLRSRVLLTEAHDTFNGLSRASLNVLYNAADLYASVSAEGFGLTIAEAMACGVPVVAMDYSSVTEVVGDAGVLVPYAHLIDNEYDHQWAAVDEDKFAEAVIRLAKKPSLRREIGARGPRRVREMFDWDTAAQQFAALVQPSSEEAVAA